MWSTFSQNHIPPRIIQETRSCQSYEPNDISVGSEPLGFLPFFWKLVVKRKAYPGRSKWVSKSGLLFFLLLRDIPIFEHLSLTESRIWKCWKLLKSHSFIAISPNCGVEIFTVKNAVWIFVEALFPQEILLMENSQLVLEVRFLCPVCFHFFPFCFPLFSSLCLDINGL